MAGSRYLLYLKSRSRGRVLQLVLDDAQVAERAARHLASYFETFIDEIAEVVTVEAGSTEEFGPEFESYDAFSCYYWY